MQITAGAPSNERFGLLEYFSESLAVGTGFRCRVHKG